MTINEIHMQIVGHRDLIRFYKEEINKCDRHIRALETELGKKIEAGEWTTEETPSYVTGHSSECELCMGNCDA